MIIVFFAIMSAVSCSVINDIEYCDQSFKISEAFVPESVNQCTVDPPVIFYKGDKIKERVIAFLTKEGCLASRSSPTACSLEHKSTRTVNNKFIIDKFRQTWHVVNFAINKATEALVKIDNMKTRSLSILEFYEQHISKSAIASIIRDIIMWTIFIFFVVFLFVFILFMWKNYTTTKTNSPNENISCTVTEPITATEQINAIETVAFTEPARPNELNRAIEFAQTTAPTSEDELHTEFCMCENKCFTRKCPCKERGGCNTRCHPGNIICVNK